MCVLSRILNYFLSIGITLLSFRALAQNEIYGVYHSKEWNLAKYDIDLNFLHTYGTMPFESLSANMNACNDPAN